MTPVWYHRLLTPGMRGTDVLMLQSILRASQTGELDDQTVALVRGVQRLGGLETNGIVCEDTASLVGDDARREAGLPPTWFGTDRQDERVRHLIGDEDAVRRLQSSHGLPVTGVVCEETACLIGE